MAAAMAATVAPPITCTAYRYICAEYLGQNCSLYLCNDRISFGGPTGVTQWHGVSLHEDMRMLQLLFNYHGIITDLRWARLFQVGSDPECWEGLDYAGEYVRLEIRERWQWNPITGVWIRTT